MGEAGRVEPLPDRAYHAVHHPAGGDHVGARPGVDDRLLGQELQGAIVVDVGPSGGVAQRAAMAVVGVFAEADVGHQQQLRGSLLGHADGLGDDAGVAGGIAAGGVFLGGDAEEDHAAQAQFGGLADFVGQQVGRELKIARHGRDLPTHVLAGANEQRQDQVCR